MQQVDRVADVPEKISDPIAKREERNQQTSSRGKIGDEPTSRPAHRPHHYGNETEQTPPADQSNLVLKYEHANQKDGQRVRHHAVACSQEIAHHSQRYRNETYQRIAADEKHV